MKRFLFALALVGVFFSGAVQAKSAEPFDGWYAIENPQTPQKEYFRLDVDTLMNIWLKYGEEGKPIPGDWEPHKDKIMIFGAFTNRDYLLLTFESNALVGDGFLGVYEQNGDIFELRSRADGRSDLAIQERGQVSRYLLGHKSPVPNSLLSPLELR